jgi:hypothetical protein
MPMTPNNSAASLLPILEFLKRKDVRTVGDFCSDTDARATQTQLTQTSPPSQPNLNLQACLDDAQAIVEAFCLKGNRYQPTDLAALTGVGLTLLYRILADLAEECMYERRPDKKRPQSAQFDRAHMFLDMLASGQMIFGFVEVQAAGELTAKHETWGDVYRRNLAVVQCERFFGHRGNVSPHEGREWGAW